MASCEIGFVAAAAERLLIRSAAIDPLLLVSLRRRSGRPYPGHALVVSPDLSLAVQLPQLGGSMALCRATTPGGRNRGRACHRGAAVMLSGRVT